MSSSSDGRQVTAIRPKRMGGALAGLRRRLANLRAQWRISLNPKSGREARLVSAQITMISSASRYHGYILPIIGLAIAINFIETLPWIRVLAWWVPVAMLFAGSALAGRYRPPPAADLTPRETAWTAKIFTIVTAILTAVWCAMMPVLWVPGDHLNHVVLVLIIASSMASSSSVNASHFVSGTICMWIYGLTLIITPLIAEGHIDHFFLLMAVAFLITMIAQMDSNYEMTRKMLSLQDERAGLVDNLKRAKGESDAARYRAEEASRAKSQFLANMSHELRTPLNAILGFSEMIHTDVGGDRPGKHREYAKIVYDSGHHLLALINDVLDLAKIEAGGLELRETDVNLESLIAETLRMMDAKAIGAGVTLKCETSKDLPAVRADERALKQVLLNLLSNALKFTPLGGEIIAFAFLEGDGAAAFGVRDTGVGISEDDQSRVFEKFGQGRHDIVTMEKGTGLGLAIVKGLVAVHGGEVTLVSRVGDGTSVTIRLPNERSRGRGTLQAAS